MKRSIKDLINRILWDEKENKADYSFYYLDRIENMEKEIKGADIIRLEGNFIVIQRDGEEAEIPTQGEVCEERREAYLEAGLTNPKPKTI